MNEKEKIALLENTMETENGIIKPEMRLIDIPEYDSLTKLSIMVMIEDEFGKKLNANDFKNFITVRDILQVMDNE